MHLFPSAAPRVRAGTGRAAAAAAAGGAAAGAPAAVELVKQARPRRTQTAKSTLKMSYSRTEIKRHVHVLGGDAACREHYRPCDSRYLKHENICSSQKLLITYLNGFCLFGDVTVLMLVLMTRRTSKTFSQSVRKDEKNLIFSWVVCFLSL